FTLAVIPFQGNLTRDDRQNVRRHSCMKLLRSLERGDGVGFEKPLHRVQQLDDRRPVLHDRQQPYRKEVSPSIGKIDPSGHSMSASLPHLPCGTSGRGGNGPSTPRSTRPPLPSSASASARWSRATRCAFSSMAISTSTSSGPRSTSPICTSISSTP